MAITALEQFDAVIQRFGKVAGYAIGGSVLTPIITAASGMAPAWPDGLSFMTSILMLAVLILVFHFLTTSKRWAFSVLLLASAAALLLAVGGYTYARGSFVMRAPLTGDQLTLGCRYRPEIVTYAREKGLDTTRQCPGDDFRELLAKAESDPFQVWTETSIANVSYVIASLWIGLFTSLALFIGSFVIWYTRQPAAPGG
ncbi:MAG: hypothetical protein LC634_04850, partial [Sphingomonadales bacterium]|nr:hypothetical protein [Sphingomonadales bacterium]